MALIGGCMNHMKLRDGTQVGSGRSEGCRAYVRTAPYLDVVASPLTVLSPQAKCLKLHETRPDLREGPCIVFLSRGKERGLRFRNVHACIQTSMAQLSCTTRRYWSLHVYMCVLAQRGVDIT